MNIYIRLNIATNKSSPQREYFCIKHRVLSSYRLKFCIQGARRKGLKKKEKNAACAFLKQIKGKIGLDFNMELIRLNQVSSLLQPFKPQNGHSGPLSIYLP